jgi:dienelactone hydrolase
MTGIILILFAVFEIAFTIYCLRTKSIHAKIKSYARLIGFTIFLLLCMLNVTKWGMRWYLLGIFFLVLAIKGAYALISKRTIIKQFSPRRLILKAVAMILLFAVSLIPAFLFPQYQVLQPTGEFQVSTAEFTYTSDTITDYFTGGKRQVNVGFWYPKDAAGTYPLLIFSHGAFGIKNSNISAFEELASHGYVVCSIDHPGHSFYTESADGKKVIVDKAYINEVMNANKDNSYTKAECYELIKKWMKIRTEDINLTIDTILQYVAEGSSTNTIEPQQEGTMQLYQSIDRSKIGVFGHSMGAAASVQIGRERKDVGAVINIDGPYFSEITYDANLDEYVARGEQYSTPILNIYSDQVWVQLQDGTDTGTYAANKISKQICQESYDVYLKGTKHLTLTDLSLASPFLSYMLDGEADEVDAKKSIEYENKLILEFFNATLKGEGEFTSEGIYEQ